MVAGDEPPQPPDPMIDPRGPSGPAVPPVVVPRWVQLVMLPIGILALWALGRAAGTVLLVFIVAAVVALILNPLVASVQRRLRFPRGLAVAAVYVALLAVVVAIGYGLAHPRSAQAGRVGHALP